MSDEPDPDPSDETKPSDHLTDDELEAVAEKKAGTPRVLHEVIRLQGLEELKRPVVSLIFSSFAGGVTISSSLLAETFLRMRLPHTPPMELVTGLGYSVGFIIVILGNLQLFTESTVTAVLPLATHPKLANLWRLLRLWGIVLLGNLVGTLLVAYMLAHLAIIGPEQLTAAVELSARLQEHGAMDTLLLGIPSGFLIASIAWSLPNARGSEFWIVLLVTYVVAIGGFSHVVVGSAEAWLLWLTGHATFTWAIGDFILPVLVGNVIGGTGLFAVLAHGQVRGEL